MFRVQRRLFIVILLLLALAVAAPSTLSASTPKVQLAIVIDGSDSISTEEWRLQKFGIADALGKPSVVPRDGSIELCVVQIGASGLYGERVHVELEPTVVTEASIATIIETVRAMRQGRGFTPIAGGIRTSARLITRSPYFAFAQRQVINIATDGMPYDQLKFPHLPKEENFVVSEADALQARNEAIAAGIDELDVEAMGDLGRGKNQRDFLRALVYPQPGAIVPPDQMKPGFARITVDFDDFAEALIAKLNVVIGPVAPPAEIPEASSLMLLASGLAAFGAFVGVRKAREERPVK